MGPTQKNLFDLAMRRPLINTYCFVNEKLNKGGEISLRKQFCLQYLKWGSTVDQADRDKFVELAKEWRKQEDRVGAKRSLLERKARKLFQKIAKRKKLTPSREGAKKWAEESLEKGIGVHSPESKAELVERNRRQLERMKELDRFGFTSDWIVTSPTGEVFRIRNLARFCRESPHNLHRAHVGRTLKYPKNHHRGWWARKIDPEFEDL